MKIVLLALVVSFGLMNPSAFAKSYCYTRSYDKRYIDKHPGQKAVAVTMKVSPLSARQMSSNSTLSHRVLLNLTTAEGKVYVFDADANVYGCKTQDCLADVETEETPDGALTLSSTGLAYRLQLIGSEGDFTLKEKNTACKDSGDCTDELYIGAKDTNNLVYLLDSAPCSKVSVVAHQPK